MIKNKKGVEMTMKTVVIAVLCLIVLIVLVTIFSKFVKKSSTGYTGVLDESTEQSGMCKTVEPNFKCSTANPGDDPDTKGTWTARPKKQCVLGGTCWEKTG